MVILVRGVFLVRLVSLELMEFLDLLVPPSCCLSVSARVEEIRAPVCRHRKLRQPPSCLRPGWLLKDHLDQWDSLDAPDPWATQEAMV